MIDVKQYEEKYLNRKKQFKEIKNVFLEIFNNKKVIDNLNSLEKIKEIETYVKKNEVKLLLDCENSKLINLKIEYDTKIEKSQIIADFLGFGGLEDKIFIEEIINITNIDEKIKRYLKKSINYLYNRKFEV